MTPTELRESIAHRLAEAVNVNEVVAAITMLEKHPDAFDTAERFEASEVKRIAKDCDAETLSRRVGGLVRRITDEAASKSYE